MSRALHMVCLRCPWPADTGGARDMLERLKALHQKGISIHLHYFIKDGEHVAPALEPFCARVHVYRRQALWRRLLIGQPYIIACRADERLLQNLQQDDFPILFDGLHTTAFIQQVVTPGRKIVVRMHNDERRYYRALARYERNLFKRLYFWIESSRIDRWMHRLPKHVQLGCVQEEERLNLACRYGFEEVFLLPPPIPDKVEILTGLGGYCLYHGNLSVGENERAVTWLLRRVFAGIKLPLVVTGKAPSRKLEQLIHFYQHACLVPDPSPSELKDLIQKAQLHVLPSKTNTGIKQKIFDTLQFGRHCLINDNMRHASPWTDSCEVANGAEQMSKRIQELYTQPFTRSMIEARESRLRQWRMKLDPVDALIKRLW